MSQSPTGGAPATPAPSSPNPQPAKARRSLRTRWRQAKVVDKATVIGTIAGILSLIVAIIALPWGGDDDNKPPAVTGSADVTTPTGGGNSTKGGPSTTVEYLAGSAFPADAGGANLIAVPRAIAADPGYTDHPIAISCPSNQSGDTYREVTYDLRGRYLDLSATVRPYYPPGSDTRSRTHVTVYTGTRQVNGDLRIDQAGQRTDASPTEPQPLTASVEKAEKLTLRVECEDSRGTIVLTGATVSRSQ